MQEGTEKKPLYCFKLDSETKEIKKFIITDYKLYNKYSRKFYSYEMDLGTGRFTYNANVKDIDEVVYNNKVHSFVGDLDYAIEIFKFHFNDKKTNAHNDYMRWKKVCDTLEELYPGEDDDE